MRPRLVPIAAAMVLAACGDVGTTPAPTCAGTSCAAVPGPPAELVAYVDHALDIMQLYSINKKLIDWPAFRADVHQKIFTGTTLADMRTGVSYALAKLGDKHSYLLFPTPPTASVTFATNISTRTPIAVGTIVAGRLAWVEIPSQFSRGDTAHAFAEQVQQLIVDLDRQNPCGWIVDLRAIVGGDMWPTLAGLAPVLGDGTLGAFVTADGTRVSWFASAGVVGTKVGSVTDEALLHLSAPYTLKRAMPPVAVILGGLTAGAGEAIATAFSGRPLTRLFGLPTYGVPTADEAYELRDGSVMYLTVAADADRTGKVFWPSAIMPDEVQPDALYYPLSNDDASLAARNWLLATNACSP